MKIRKTFSEEFGAAFFSENGSERSPQTRVERAVAAVEGNLKPL